MSGIYLHIPFCNSKCIYCGFYSVVGQKYKEAFIPALKREIFGRRDFFTRNLSEGNFSSHDEKLHTLYIGGGTPSVLDISLLKEAVGCIKDTFSFPLEAFSSAVSPDIFEFTVEVNPDDVTPEYAHELMNLGVNRVSMGVQSFEDKHLSWMRRRHTSEQAVEAFRILRDAGFNNISLDLIFGYASLTDDEWMHNLEKTVSLSPEHISAYQMMLDEGTPLERLEEKRSYMPPEEEICAAQYAMLQSVLKDAGYIQYEVSNFAAKKVMDGKETLLYSRHNSNYWNRTPYLGLGPGAHSFDGKNREWNLPDVAEYCSSDICDFREGEILSEKDEFNETVMLGLRRTEGVEFSGLNPNLLNKISDVINRLVEDGSLEMVYEESDDDVQVASAVAKGIKIPPEKLFVSDGIIRELFILNFII
ncbi:MAG: radical SAM family heme chaperone HemW [Candidatus Egerieousia sp.]